MIFGSNRYGGRFHFKKSAGSMNWFKKKKEKVKEVCREQEKGGVGTMRNYSGHVVVVLVKLSLL